MTKAKIALATTDTCWYAIFLDHKGQPDESIIDAFGTHKLPTAYSAECSAEHVKRAVQAKWADRVVTLA